MAELQSRQAAFPHRTLPEVTRIAPRLVSRGG